MEWAARVKTGNPGSQTVQLGFVGVMGAPFSPSLSELTKEIHGLLLCKSYLSSTFLPVQLLSASGALRPIHVGLSDYEYINLNDCGILKEDVLTRASSKHDSANRMNKYIVGYHRCTGFQWRITVVNFSNT